MIKKIDLAMSYFQQSNLRVAQELLFAYPFSFIIFLFLTVINSI